MAKVESGQLRRWNRENDSDYDKLFVILQRDQFADVTGFQLSVWEFLQEGNVRSYTEATLLCWSEVISEG